MAAPRTALVFYTHGSGHSLAPDDSVDGDVLWSSELSAALEERDAVVDISFGREAFPGFEPGHHGLFLTFPDGDAPFLPQRTGWERFRWYGPDVVSDPKLGFGRSAFARDGATRGDGKVENWFELLDAWFDAGDPKTGGVNGYAW